MAILSDFMVRKYVASCLHNIVWFRVVCVNL